MKKEKLKKKNFVNNKNKKKINKNKVRKQSDPKVPC